MITFSYESKAIGVCLSDGEVLSTFTSLSVVSALEQLSEVRNTRAAKYRVYGVDYVKK